MDRETPSATRALVEVTRNAARPRRRWWDGPNLPWTSQTDTEWAISPRWPLVCALLSEQAASDANAIRRELKRLHADGRITRTDASGIDTLAQAIRTSGVTAQKIIRLAAGNVQPRPEPVNLTQLARDVALEMRTALQRRRAELRLDIRPAQVHVDPALAIELANAALRWGMAFSNSLVLAVTAASQGDVRLVVRADRAVPAQLPGQGPAQRTHRINDNLGWLHLRQLAAVANLKVVRSSQDTWEVASIEFPRTAAVDGISTEELLPSAEAQRTLDDGRVLVVVRNRKVRQSIMRILLANGLEPVLADSVQQARAACDKRKPRAIVSCQEQPQPPGIRDALGIDPSRCALVQVTVALPTFQASGFTDDEWVRIGIERLDAELIPALLFELAQQGGALPTA